MALTSTTRRCRRTLGILIAAALVAATAAMAAATADTNRAAAATTQQEAYEQAMDAYWDRFYEEALAATLRALASDELAEARQSEAATPERVCLRMNAQLLVYTGAADECLEWAPEAVDGAVEGVISRTGCGVISSWWDDEGKMVATPDGYTCATICEAIAEVSSLSDPIPDGYDCARLAPPPPTRAALTIDDCSSESLFTGDIYHCVRRRSVERIGWIARCDKEGIGGTKREGHVRIGRLDGDTADAVRAALREAGRSQCPSLRN